MCDVTYDSQAVAKKVPIQARRLAKELLSWLFAVRPYIGGRDSYM